MHSSVVRRRRLLLCYSPLVRGLGPEHEKKGENHGRRWSESWNIVRRIVLGLLVRV